MNVIKRFSVMALTVMSMSLGAGNFDIVNSNPKTPVYYSINNGAVKGLGGAHLRESRKVEVGKQLKITFSAKADGSNPMHFSFVPAQKEYSIRVHADHTGRVIIEQSPAGTQTMGKQACTKPACIPTPAPAKRVGPAPAPAQNDADLDLAIARSLADQQVTPARARRVVPAPAPAPRPAPAKRVGPAPAPAQNDADLDLAIARSLAEQEQEAPAAVPAPVPGYEEPAAPAEDANDAAMREAVALSLADQEESRRREEQEKLDALLQEVALLDAKRAPAAVPAPAEEDDADLRKAMALSLAEQEQEQEAPAKHVAPAPRPVAPAEDGDATMHEAIALSLEEQGQEAPAKCFIPTPAPAQRPVAAQDPYEEDLAALRASEARNRSAELPTYREAVKLLPQVAPAEDQANTAANAQPVAKEETKVAAKVVVPAKAAIASTKGLDAVVNTATVRVQTAPVRDDVVALPVVPEEQAAEDKPAPARRDEEQAAPAAVVAEPEFGDPIVEQLKANSLAASNILGFFQPDCVISSWLDKTQERGNFAGLAQLIKNLMQPNKEAFKTTVRNIMEMQPDEFLPENNCIDFMFDHVITHVDPVANQAVTACIVNLYKAKPDFVENVDDLTTLLTQWEAHLKSKAPMDTTRMWQGLEPLSKIYYLELASFYFVAQSALDNMAPAAK